MKKPFCCDASRNMYVDYYARQQRGHGMPYFVGSRYQRGHGLGSVLSGLFRRALPVLKSAGAGMLKTGMEIASDVLQGENLKDAAVKRAKQTAQSALKTGMRMAQEAISGQQGIKRPAQWQTVQTSPKKSTTTRKKAKKKAKGNTIFDGVHTGRKL